MNEAIIPAHLMLWDKRKDEATIDNAVLLEVTDVDGYIEIQVPMPTGDVFLQFNIQDLMRAVLAKVKT